MPLSQSFCSDSSEKSGEQLLGTATRADFWLALEVPQAYGRNAFEASALPGPVKTGLAEKLGRIRNSRLQLIKKSGMPAGEGIRLFAAVNHEERPNLYELTLDRYEDLLDLDLEGLAAEKREFWQYDRKAPVYLVCTNARRDPCCARFGLPVYEKAREIVGEAAWQTSHIGGHRFAATLVTLPHGVYYGYLAADSVAAVLQAQENGRIHLKNFRGRSCYDPHVQAAAALLRQEAGLEDLYRLKLIEVEALAEAEWRFHFNDLVDGRTYCAHVRQELSEFEVYKSCREQAPARVPQFHLLDHQVHAALRSL
jgi:hypothetical protein